MPRSIVSDRDKIFTSTFWKQLFNKLGTKLHYTTTYHPQTDGQTERVNQCLEMFLRCTVQDTPRLWRSCLPLAEFWYNSTVHSSLGCSPLKALYGHEPDFGAMPDALPDETSPVMDVLTARAAQLTILKQNLATAQNRMKQNTDKHRTKKEFQVGDKVLLKLQPYTQASVVNRPFPKLAYKYFGPFQILDRVGKVAYRLELPPDSQVHNVFHISQLKEYHPDYTPVFATLPRFPSLDTMDTEPDAILERRLVKKGNAAVPQVLIKWLGLPTEQATWEYWEVLKVLFPSVLAWGQASSSPGGIVTPGTIGTP